MHTPQLHSFHIPVMGLAFTVDSPIKVARFGINSVISIIEDKLIELMRKHYCVEFSIPYTEITPDEPDYRARRITGYLNLVNSIVKEQVDKLRQSAFEAGSDIVKYFEMLPYRNVLRLAYEKMVASDNGIEKEAITKYLRSQITPGRIDVNIMTKVDKNNYDKQGNLLVDASDALAALRGYANSDLTNSSIIFSAGLNPRLFNYLEKFTAFRPTNDGTFEKEIVIKVSDFRSAFIQGKYLAKKGIWVSEFRIESGLNCGGHAFATDGSLLGPILEEFKSKREELSQTLHSLYTAALVSKGCDVSDKPHPIRFSVQGGIGTSEENAFLLSRYEIDSTGWGTPFLLCPEATTVDDETLNLLCKARENDISLSNHSPLGIRFNYLKNTSAEKERLERIRKGKPGSPCTEKHLVANTEFTTEPICTASRAYQRKKIEQLKTLGLAEDVLDHKIEEVTSKECLCIGLSNSAILKHNLPKIKKFDAVTVCPGPNIAYFDKIVTLQQMVDHIYGRSNILDAPNRPHMFIKELELNVDYLREKMQLMNVDDSKLRKDSMEFANQLLAGVEYYQGISEAVDDDGTFVQQLTELRYKIEDMTTIFAGKVHHIVPTQG
jgi:hypothetical protein